ncbi:hypothetical protein RHMOL_Rhmol08G0021400 [Rhododendron molle]|uniref:Uncharacterized protein n=1 Tax=Rhododendron molle TaxID=49168 RepID=A0ACC0MK66_RHOML|nr:hypothetical protein RHMOL_Rhmol08G0021400 [Rhododendron molle]
MDKSWMTIRNRLASREYKLGVESLLQFAMANLGPQPEIRCPCNECLNGRKHSFAVVKIHLIRRGIDSSYKTWVHHGESVPAPQAYDDDHHDPNEGIGDVMSTQYCRYLVRLVPFYSVLSCVYLAFIVILHVR